MSSLFEGGGGFWLGMAVGGPIGAVIGGVAGNLVGGEFSSSSECLFDLFHR